MVLPWFRSNMFKKHWFYSVFAPTCWKCVGFTVVSAQNVEKAEVLRCCRSALVLLWYFWKVLKKQRFCFVFSLKCWKINWFYVVFAQKCLKSNGFILFSLKKCKKKKTMVLQCFRFEMLKEHWFYNKTNGFSNKPKIRKGAPNLTKTK